MKNAITPAPSSPRSVAQQEAARRNGALSRGPVTVLGKSRASTNATRHGFTAHCVLLPGETLEERQQHLDLFLETRMPSTPVEALLVVRWADAFHRLDRLDRFREELAQTDIERALAESDSAKKLSTLTEACEAVAALALTAEQIQRPVPFEAVQQLAPGMRRVFQAVEDLVPVPFAVRLRDALNDVVVESFVDVAPETFHSLGACARDIEAFLTAAVAAARAEVTAERERLALDPTLGDEDQLRRLDRVRARIMRELDGLAHLIRQVRELADPGEHRSGSFVHVELRLVARPRFDSRSDLACE